MTAPPIGDTILETLDYAPEDAEPWGIGRRGEDLGPVTFTADSLCLYQINPDEAVYAHEPSRDAVDAFLWAHGVNPRSLAAGVGVFVWSRQGIIVVQTWRAVDNTNLDDAPRCPNCPSCGRQEYVAVHGLRAPVPVLATLGHGWVDDAAGLPTVVI